MDWKGLFHQIRGKSQQPTDELEGEADNALQDLKGRIGRRQKADLTTCPQGHPLFKGQRAEDCYDCHLVGIGRQEWSQEKKTSLPQKLQGALLCVKGFHEGSVFALRLAEDVPLYLGSDPDCEIVLSDAQISRRHLMVVSRQGRTIVRDLNSLHHSALRAKDELQWYVLDPDREYWCEDGTHLVLGDVEMLYRAVDAQALRLGGEHVLVNPGLPAGATGAPLTLTDGG